MTPFVGRKEPLARLTAAYLAVAARSSGAVPGWAGLALVTGEAGIGKTALLTRFSREVAAAGGTVVWGTCWDGDQAPALWPWAQALRALLDRHRGLVDAADPALSAILPELVDHPQGPADVDAAGRVRVFDAVGRLLRQAAEHQAVVVVLDDLHWADESTVELLRFLVRRPQQGAVFVVGAYRSHESPTAVTAAVGELAAAAELVALRGLSAEEIADLARAVTGTRGSPAWLRAVHERSGGHPFYARELCQVFTAFDAGAQLPVAVRDVVGRRLTRLSAPCLALLEVAAVGGTTLLPDVLAEAGDEDPSRVAVLLVEAVAAGILVPGGDADGATRFVHDLYREALYAALTPDRRITLHHRMALALVSRRERGGRVFETELAHHFTAAIPMSDMALTLAWTHAAARADASRFAFADGAGHLTRLRSAVAARGRLAPADFVGVLTTEADLRLRAGDADQARDLLHTAWGRAEAAGHGDLLGSVALGLDQVGARFAMPRADLVAVLTVAHTVLRGTGTAMEATVTAALARQLQHSVPPDRPRAGPLAADAVRIARTLGDPATLASCLLAQHDALWTAGTAAVRAGIATEIADLAGRAGDAERHAQALLLAASAQLENGSPAFRATFATYAESTRRLRQPRQDYVLLTRRAALALLDGDIDEGERMSEAANSRGESVGDSDAGNVRMSQRLEVVRARNQPAELREMAVEAVSWWVGAPAHAHAVAAGYCARAGDLDLARRELDTVLALDDWRTDRSYLWSIFIGEMATAAIAVGDAALCERLLDDLLPVAGACAVNGALVCFMGAHAYRVGLLCAALGQLDGARHWLRHAVSVHRRLGARIWLAESEHALAAIDQPDGARTEGIPAAVRSRPPGAAEATSGSEAEVPRLLRTGDMWQATYLRHTVYLRDTKGLHDLAVLLARPGEDVPALELAGAVAAVDRRQAAEPVLDRTALTAYRRRLAEIDEELAIAGAHADLARQLRVTDEREQLLAELRRATRPRGGLRTLGNTAAERARKAVTARVREAIRRIADVHRELGAHLDRSVRTGTTCRYEPPAR
jgi:hypothetical protein